MGVKKWNQFKNFIQVEVDVKCMQIDFGGCDLSVSEILLRLCCLQNSQNFPSVHGGQKIESAQKIQASRG